MLGAALTANAQQVNGTFDDDWENCSPWTGVSKTKQIGTQPKGWCVSNVAGTVPRIGSSFSGTTQVADQVSGRSGYAVKLYNAPNSVLSSKTVPGYLTLGTTWSTSTGTGSNTDGGTWGGKTFTYKPDAIHFWYQRTASEGNDDKPASIIAYLWKGTYTQAAVPCNIRLSGSADKVNMENRDANIMGKETAQGGDITSKGTRIAQIETYITDVTTDWTEKTIEFTYEDKNSSPEMINIIFAASDYFNQSVAQGNTFTIDDVTLIYYSTLSTLTYDGTNLLSNATTSTDGKTVSVDMSTTLYQASKIAYTLKGVGASVLSEGYNDKTGIYTIQVAGNDNNNGSNVTTYNIQFLPVVNIEAGKTIETTAQKAKVVMTRDFKQGWNTVCLPFATTASALGATKVQQFSAGDDQSVTFAEVTNGAIAANTPYLVFFNSAKNWTSSAPFEAVVTLEATSPKSVTHGAFTFSGNYTAGKNMNGLYGVATVDGIQRLRKGNSSATLPAGCAYFTSTSAKANGLAISFDGQTTGIANIDAAIDAQPTGAVYNLQGVKVSTNGTAGLPAGLYIQGGRKIIVK